MGQPTSLLRNARAFARDFARDNMPPGYLWDVADYVPTIIDASLTGRGGWLWGSTVMGGDPETGFYATFSTGDKLLVQATNGRMYEVLTVPPFTATDRFPVPRAKQNPVQLVDTVIHFDKASTMTPRLLTAPGGVLAITAANAAHKFAPVGCVYKSMLVSAGAPGELDTVRFSVPNKNLANADSFDDVSRYPTSLPVTGIAALRSVVLIFHSGSVERMRGATPAHSPTSLGDMVVESLFDRAGCVDPLTIAYWNDNCVFADEHGVHVTDGSVIRNIVSQGGILTLWRMLYELKQTLCATTFLDYYIVTLRRTDGIVMTLVCDLNKRQWFRFTNLPALVHIASSSGLGMERIWSGLAGKARLARIGPCFFPSFTSAQIQDDDGTPVLPVFETPWYRLGQEGLKRVRFAYLSYDVRAPGDDPDAVVGPGGVRRGEDDDGIPAEHVNGIAARAIQQTLEVGYIRSPQESSYVPIGILPTTSEYSRYRLPVGQNPYGIGFKVTQLLPSVVTRIFDLGVEAGADERSRTQ
jgi:hypothetical protein